MSNAPAQQKHPLVAFKDQLDQRVDQFRHALPAHMPAERFARVVLTAVQNNLELLTADRQSLWNACMRAAQDGLLPDGREGAIVIYNTKEGGGWVKKAQWMPMVYGILKKARNSGQIAMITARVVYAGDKYRYWVDEEGEHILYEPSETPDKTLVRLVFAAARTKDGELLVEPLTPDDIEKIRAVSRAKERGPWVDWWEEMAKKSAIRRLSKRLPMSSDIDDLVRRDDDLYDLDAARDARKPQIVDLDAAFSGGAESGAPRHAPATAQAKTESPAAGASAGADARADGARGEGPTPPADHVSSDDEEPAITALEDSIAAALIDCVTLNDVAAAESMFSADLAKVESATVRDRIRQQFANVSEAIGNRENADDGFPGDRPMPGRAR